MIKLLNGDSSEIIKGHEFFDVVNGKNPIIVTDPPFNVGYHYNEYKDNMNEDDYYSWLNGCVSNYPCVIIHYPESLYRLSHEMGIIPEKVISWVYNSNTPKQHRDIAFFGVKPIFSQVTQPYKNISDKRVQKMLELGKDGANIYDWWFVNQIKNVSNEKTKHPCQMPLEVMENIVRLLPQDNLIVIDPFMGSGTTGVACKNSGIDFVGIELDKMYYNIAKQRIENEGKKEELF